MTKLSVFLNKIKNSYNPGDNISGKCTVEVNNSIKFQTFYVNLKGKAYVHWTESKGSGKNRRTVTYSSIHYLFDTKSVLLASTIENNNEPMILTSGIHSFDFNFILPQGDFPSSYEGRHGWVRYYVKAKIVRKMAFDDVTSAPFCILNPPDINNNYLQNAREMSNVKTIGCCCPSPPVTINLICHKTGVRPGDNLSISASCFNCTSSSLIPQFLIICETIFIATRKQRSVYEIVYKHVGTEVGVGQELNWENYKLQIPNINYTLNNCPNIKVDYYAIMKMKAGTCSNIEVKIPLVIGEVKSLPVPSISPFQPLPVPSVSPFQTPPGPSNSSYNPTAPQLPYKPDVDFSRQNPANPTFPNNPGFPVNSGIPANSELPDNSGFPTNPGFPANSEFPANSSLNPASPPPPYSAN